MREPKHETRAKKAKLAISYITFGTLIVVWGVVWLLYLTMPQDVSGWVYIAAGAVVSGIAVVLIGIKVGDIGKEANRDEEDPEDEHNENKEIRTVPRAGNPNKTENPNKPDVAAPAT